MNRNVLLHFSLAFCGAIIVPSYAEAADLGGTLEPRQVYANAYTEPVAVGVASDRKFYVRGDLGIGVAGFGGFNQQDLANNGGRFLSTSVGDMPYIGAGLGWSLNRHFRIDLTGEYRSTAQVKALDNVTGFIAAPATNIQANTVYTGNLSSLVGLLNGYVDIGNWRGFTPYVGAGIGFANNRMKGFTSQSSGSATDVATGAVQTQLSNGYSTDYSQTKMAWALMAGTSYDLSANAKLDIGYRYLNLGSGVTASSNIIDCICGSVGQPLQVRDLHANEFRIGVRWLLNDTPAASAPSYQPLK